MEVFSQIKDDNTKADLDLYIDDANQYVAQYDVGDTLLNSFYAITHFAEGTKRLKLTLSDKAGLVSHPPWIAVKLSKLLKTRGVHLKAHLSYRYLGTSFLVEPADVTKY